MNNPPGFTSCPANTTTTTATATNQVKSKTATAAARAAISTQQSDNLCPTQIFTMDSPLISCTPDFKNAYQTNNWEKIQQYESWTQNDYQEVIDRINNTPNDGAWNRVSDSKVNYYSSWGKKATLYAFPVSIVPTNMAQRMMDPNSEYCATVSIGLYCESPNTLSTWSLGIGLPTKLEDVAVSLMVCKTLAKFLYDGLDFQANHFADVLTQSAHELGIYMAKFSIQDRFLGQLAQSLQFTIANIGMASLYKFPSRRNTYRIGVFNWDNNNNWSVANTHFTNGVTPGYVKSGEDIYVTILNASSKNTAPRTFSPRTPLTCIAPYSVYIFENNASYPEGSTITLNVLPDGYGFLNKNFTYAYNGPITPRNGHFGQAAPIDPSQLVNSSSWTANNLNFVSPIGIPISAAMVPTANAPNSLYTANLHINFNPARASL